MRAGILSSPVVLISAVVLSSGRATSVDAESRLLRAENVFGWRQDKSSILTQGCRSNPRPVRKSKYSNSHSSSSPLKRSENVFGWQQSNDNPRRNELQRTSRKKFPKGSGVLNTNSSTKTNSIVGNVNDANSNHAGSSQPRISPPNIKLQPRKKELWLPWPLGALRNDYNRFAEQQRLKYGYEQSNQQPEQERLRRYYSDEYDGYRSPSNIFVHGRNWAGRVFQRGQSLMPRGLKHDDSDRKSTSPGFWVKDTTTSMAAASATMDRKKQEEEQLVNPSRYNKSSKQKDTRGGDSEDGREKNHWDHEMIFKYVKLQVKVRLRQLDYVRSDFSVHLPPASPTLLLLYMLPSTQDPLRRLVKISLTGATISWMHSEATKYRRFAPLPTMQGMNVRRPDLLPFLPEELVDKNDNQNSGLVENDRRSVGTKVEINANNSSLWDPFQSFGTVSSAYRSWLEGQSIQSRRSHQQRRIQAQTQLLAVRESSTNTTVTSSAKNENSYALITGASRGIGRALAVELARYRIPLILVARDISKLAQVANDIETYYNVPCRILQADLSTPDCASRIHAATTEAGLNVDILVNNAGVCDQGEMVEGDIHSTMNMVQVNVGSVVQLSHLYGKDMKERRRGRILFVSSMAGAMPGCASVAVYAATKSFEKSLASSLGREMERYGIGVTCLLPGAVRDTDFASRSCVEDAVCFQVPGYAKSPEMVAGEGIKALMLGYPEVYPGWENRIFAKLGLPFCPPRIAGLIGEYAWSPCQLGIPSTRKIEVKALPSVPSHTWKFRRPSLGSGILRLPDMPKRQTFETKVDGFADSPRDGETIKLNNTNAGVDPIISNSDALVAPVITGASASSFASSSSSANLSLSEIQDHKIPSESLLQLHADEKGPWLGHSEYDTGINSGEVDTVIIPKSNETWYPSMLGQKQYDFRDRRLDY